MRDKNPFLHPECLRTTLDIYGPRHSILRAMQAQLSRFRGVLLDVGCGRMPYKSIMMASPSQVEQYVGLDLGREHYGRPDVVWDGRTIPLPDNSIDCAIATEVFEHCPDPGAVMCEVARVLKQDGLLFFTVPFLWPLHDAPYDEYRYTPFAIERLLKDAGFCKVDTAPLGGWDASLAQMLGLWIRRRPMSRILRHMFGILAVPLVRLLFRIENYPQPWSDTMMFTGLSGTAMKSP